MSNLNLVQLLGHYGGDETHALSAWTSTARDLTDDKRQRIDAMLSMLAKNGHHTPFEKSCLHFLVCCDTASHIHLLKHRIGVSINAESARYKELKENKYYLPVDWPIEQRQILEQRIKQCYGSYHTFIQQLETAGFSRKRAKESARFILPYANQCVMDISFNFRSFMHFQSLRNTDKAQTEIREIADQMLQLVWDINVFDKSLTAFGYAK